MFRTMWISAVVVFSLCFAVAQSGPAQSAAPKSDADALPDGLGQSPGAEVMRLLPQSSHRDRQARH